MDNDHTPGEAIRRAKAAIVAGLEAAGYRITEAPYPDTTITFLGVDPPDSDYGMSLTLNITP